MIVDLRDFDSAMRVMSDVEVVYALAADMGGMGYLADHDAEVMRNNSLIDLHCLEAARRQSVCRYLFASSACVYPIHLQAGEVAPRLREPDAYPALPPDGYGWEKLFAEQLCDRYLASYGLAIRVVRLHNVYGPLGTWRGGREKAPAALCRKMAIAALSKDPVVEIWGDGFQRRSFCYIDDCVTAMIKVMDSDCSAPVNVGQETDVSIRELAAMIAEIAGVSASFRFVDGPEGVRARSCDLNMLKEVTGWRPDVPLLVGMEKTYEWILDQVGLDFGKRAARAER
jgi:nucleoside-diphosphate-sugar epimerase